MRSSMLINALSAQALQIIVYFFPDLISFWMCFFKILAACSNNRDFVTNDWLCTELQLFKLFRVYTQPTEVSLTVYHILFFFIGWICPSWTCIRFLGLGGKSVLWWILLLWRRWDGMGCVSFVPLPSSRRLLFSSGTAVSWRKNRTISGKLFQTDGPA